MEKRASLRERKKEATRRVLLATANRHFHESGFEATTIDAICDEVGVSRRTFFRYFPSKEALVFPNRVERLQRFLAFLQHAPHGENPFDTLRRAARVFAAEYMENREQLIVQQKLIQGAPELVAMEHEIDCDWEAAMAQAFRERTGAGPASELHARVLAGAAIGVIRATMRHWFATDGTANLERLGREALDCLERGFAHPPGAGSGRGGRAAATQSRAGEDATAAAAARGSSSNTVSSGKRATGRS
jgi:AcrR family transcriptional regulator